MPKQYESMRDQFKSEGLSDRAAKAKAAAIYNSKHPKDPVTRVENKGYAEGGEVRDPSSHRTPTQIKRMDRGYNSSPEMIRRRSEQNKARAMLGLKKGDLRDAGHKKPLDKGGSTTKSNLEAQSRGKNRGWRRDWEG